MRERRREFKKIRRCLISKETQKWLLGFTLNSPSMWKCWLLLIFPAVAEMWKQDVLC
jgi:hypothetical protein